MELQTAVNALVLALATWLVTEGLKALSSALGRDLSGNAAAITAALVALILALITPVLGSIPEAYAGAVTQAAYLIVAVLGAFGTHRTLTRFGTPPAVGKAAGKK